MTCSVSHSVIWLKKMIQKIWNLFSLVIPIFIAGSTIWKQKGKRKKHLLCSICFQAENNHLTKYHNVKADWLILHFNPLAQTAEHCDSSSTKAVFAEIVQLWSVPREMGDHLLWSVVPQVFLLLVSEQLLITATFGMKISLVMQLMMGSIFHE